MVNLTIVAEIMAISIEETRRKIALIGDNKRADLNELNNLNLSYPRIEELDYSIEAAEEATAGLKGYR